MLFWILFFLNLLKILLTLLLRGSNLPTERHTDNVLLILVRSLNQAGDSPGDTILANGLRPPF